MSTLSATDLHLLVAGLFVACLALGALCVHLLNVLADSHIDAADARARLTLAGRAMREMADDYSRMHDDLRRANARATMAELRAANSGGGKAA